MDCPHVGQHKQHLSQQQQARAASATQRQSRQASAAAAAVDSVPTQWQRALLLSMSMQLPHQLPLSPPGFSACACACAPQVRRLFAPALLERPSA